MTVVSAFFYLFATLLVLSALMVILARNPVHAVIFLIIAFFNAAGLFVLLGAEFLAMVLVIVYVGAVAVLFLFVVMMLDVDFAELRAGFVKFLPLGLLIGLGLLAQLVMIFSAWKMAPGIKANIASPVPEDKSITNTEALGRILYTDYVYLFEVAGLVLLVAMIGAIILTLRHKKGVKRQDISAQVARKREDSIEIRKVDTGTGIDRT